MVEGIENKGKFHVCNIEKYNPKGCILQLVDADNDFTVKVWKS